MDKDGAKIREISAVSWGLPTSAILNKIRRGWKRHHGPEELASVLTPMAGRSTRQRQRGKAARAWSPEENEW